MTRRSIPKREAVGVNERLQRLLEDRAVLEQNGPNSEEGQQWLANVAATLREVSPSKADEFEHYAFYAAQPLTSQTLVPIWSNMLRIVRTAIAQTQAPVEASGLPNSRQADQYRTLTDYLQQLEAITALFAASGSGQEWWQRFQRWRDDVAGWIRTEFGSAEAKRFAKLPKTPGMYTHRFDDVVDAHRAFLTVLMESLSSPASTVPELKAAPSRIAVPTTRTVLVIHGHDETNTLRLKNLLVTRWNLNPVILADRPDRGRTLIQKFEEEAAQAAYAFALVTPDDTVHLGEGEYTQARPNVVFELGWFYGRFGRDRVTILFRQGTKLHSDLDGIMRVEFNGTVEEKIGEIERELKAAGLIA